MAFELEKANLTNSEKVFSTSKNTRYAPSKRQVHLLCKDWFIHIDILFWVVMKKQVHENNCPTIACLWASRYPQIMLHKHWWLIALMHFQLLLLHWWPWYMDWWKLSVLDLVLSHLHGHNIKWNQLKCECFVSETVLMGFWMAPFSTSTLVNPLMTIFPFSPVQLYVCKLKYDFWLEYNETKGWNERQIGRGIIRLRTWYIIRIKISFKFSKSRWNSRCLIILLFLIRMRGKTIQELLCISNKSVVHSQNIPLCLRAALPILYICWVFLPSHFRQSLIEAWTKKKLSIVSLSLLAKLLLTQLINSPMDLGHAL